MLGMVFLAVFCFQFSVVMAESVKDLQKKQKKLQEEMLQRGAAKEETQSTLETFRQDVDNISLVCFDLEHKVDSLQEEVDFLGKLCSDESCELQAQP